MEGKMNIKCLFSVIMSIPFLSVLGGECYNIVSIREDNNTNIVHSDVFCKSCNGYTHIGYYCEKAGELSSCSFSFNENEYNGFLTVHIYTVDMERKYTQHPTGRLKGRKKIKKTLPLRKYDDIIEEFGLCMQKASMDFQIGSLDEIIIEISDLGDCSVDINNYYQSIRPPIVPNDYYLGPFYHDVAKAISMSGLKKDLNNVLKSYNVKIETIEFSDEYHIFMDKDLFLYYNVVNRHQVPDKIISGLMTCKCSPLTR